MGKPTSRGKRVIWTVAAMLLAGANCAHSCGPDLDFGSDAPGRPFEAACTGMAEGKSCPTRNDVTCEDRVFPNLACNTVWTCAAATQTWWAKPPTRTDCAVGCPTQRDARARDPGGCTDPRAGTLICDSDEGTCGCAPVEGAGDAAAPAFEWRCTKPEAGCPSSRPPLGSSCVLSPPVCDYGDCTFTDGVRFRCGSENKWVLEDTCAP